MPIALLMNFHQRSGKFPSPLWGEAGVGVGRLRASVDVIAAASRPPAPPSPTRGEEADRTCRLLNGLHRDLQQPS